MSRYDIARQMLKKLKNEHGTWQLVAEYLSQNLGQTISKTAVWKMVHGKTKSPKIMNALSLTQKRYRRAAPSN